MRLYIFIFFIFLSCTGEEKSGINTQQQGVPENFQSHENNGTSDSLKANSKTDTTIGTIHPNRIRIQVPPEKTQPPVINDVEEEVIIENYSKRKERAAIVAATFRETADSIYFVYKKTNPSVPDVGCSASKYSIQFSVAKENQSFHLTGQKLISTSFSYILQGGLYDETGKNPKSGFISGKKTDSNWMINMDVIVPVINFPMEEKFDSNLKIEQEFFPE